MQLIVLGVIAFAAIVRSSVIPLQTTATLVRTPSLDSAVIQSERLNGAFSYSTTENHAYAPVIQTYATYPWGGYYPSIYYPQPIFPTYTFVPQQQPSYIPGGVAGLPGPGQPPLEVEDPADNTENQEIINNNNSDDDTVAIESV